MARTDLWVEIGAGAIPVQRLEPSDPGPLLVVVPSIFGISPEVEVYAERFAQQGALVYVMDSFWRTAPGPLHIPGGTSAAMQRKVDLDPEDAFTDLLAVIDAGLQDAHCTGELLLLGICFGGKFTMRATQHRPVAGLAVWHGSSLLPWIAPSALAQTQLSLDFGGADPLIPLDEVEAIRAQLGHPKGVIRVHEGAGHGFSHRGTSKGQDRAADAAVAGVLAMISGRST